MATIKKDFGNKPRINNPVYENWGKIPPQAPDLEAAILGACLMERDTFDSVMEIIPNHDVFYMDVHQKIYAALCEMYNNGDQIDLLTVCNHLDKKRELELIGGKYFLTELTRNVTTSAHAQTHARIVFEKFLKRETIRICSKAIGDAYEDISDAFELVDQVENDIKNTTLGLSGGNSISVGDTYMEMLMDIEEQKENKTDTIGVSSGYRELDLLTLGWQKTDLIILAARPSQGKTAFAINFAMNAGIKKVPTLIFSLESSNKALVRRMAASKNNVPLECIRKGNLNEIQESVMHRAIPDFRGLQIKIDSRSRKLSTIKKVARKWRKTAGDDGLIIIDYLQLMSVDAKGSREQEVSQISRDLKELATELDVPIIALSQLNREVEKTANKKPGLAHLRESGAIEQDANVIMFIWWQDTGNKDSSGNPEVLTWVLVEKNRDGKCGDVQLRFNGDIQKWLNYDDYNQSELPSFIKNNFQQARNPSESSAKWDEDWQ